MRAQLRVGGAAATSVRAISRLHHTRWYRLLAAVERAPSNCCCTLAHMLLSIDCHRAALYAPAQAWFFFSFITLTKALRAWRQGAAAAHLKRERTALAYSHWRTGCLAHCLIAWQQAMVAWQQKRLKQQAAEKLSRCWGIAGEASSLQEMLPCRTC